MVRTYNIFLQTEDFICVFLYIKSRFTGDEFIFESLGKKKKKKNVFVFPALKRIFMLDNDF